MNLSHLSEKDRQLLDRLGSAPDDVGDELLFVNLVVIGKHTEAYFVAIGTEFAAALSKISDKIEREVNPHFYAAAEFKALTERGEPIAADILGNTRIDLTGALPWLT